METKAHTPWWTTRLAVGAVLTLAFSLGIFAAFGAVYALAWAFLGAAFGLLVVPAPALREGLRSNAYRNRTTAS